MYVKSRESHARLSSPPYCTCAHGGTRPWAVDKSRSNDCKRPMSLAGWATGMRGVVHAQAWRGKRKGNKEAKQRHAQTRVDWLWGKSRVHRQKQARVFGFCPLLPHHSLCFLVNIIYFYTSTLSHFPFGIIPPHHSWCTTDLLSLRLSSTPL